MRIFARVYPSPLIRVAILYAQPGTNTIAKSDALAYLRNHEVTMSHRFANAILTLEGFSDQTDIIADLQVILLTSIGKQSRYDKHSPSFA